MRDKPNARQLGALALCALSVPAATTCAGIGWQWALLGGVLSAVVYGLSAHLRPTVRLPLRTFALQALPPWAGQAVMTLAGLWSVLALAALSRSAAVVLPEAEHPETVGLILLALATWAAALGSAVPARCAGVIVLALGILYSVLSLAALRSLNLSWLRPWGTFHRAAPGIAMLLLPGAIWYLSDEEPPAAFPAVTAILALAPALLALLTSGNISPRLAAAESAPFYAMVKGLGRFGLMERFEPLVSVALVLGCFSAMTLLLRAARACFGGTERNWQLWLLSVPAAAGSFAVPTLSPVVWLLGTSIFWAILPLALPLVVSLKKYRKKRK